MKTSYLDFYYSCMQTGVLPRNGLCLCFFGDPLLTILIDDHTKYSAYDGTGIKTQDVKDPYLKKAIPIMFTPLRQNIVLLMAAMNNEL